MNNFTLNLTEALYKKKIREFEWSLFCLLLCVVWSKNTFRKSRHTLETITLPISFFQQGDYFPHFALRFYVTFVILQLFDSNKLWEIFEKQSQIWNWFWTAVYQRNRAIFRVFQMSVYGVTILVLTLVGFMHDKLGKWHSFESSSQSENSENRSMFMIL